MTRQVLKTSCGLHLVSQSESTLIDPKGRVIQQAVEDLARTAIGLKLEGHRVVVAVGEPLNSRSDSPDNQFYRTGYAAMLVSQTKLMAEWEKCFDACNELSAQVLVDAVVSYTKHREQQLIGVLTELIEMSVIPVVGLSAAGRGVGRSLLDTFLINLLDRQGSSSHAQEAV